MNLRSEALRSQMRLLRRELESPGTGSCEAAAALTRLLGIELERLLDQDLTPSPGGRLAPWQFRRIRERLEGAGERPSVPELADLCGISVRHLHRQFLNLTGVTISDYVEGQMQGGAVQGIGWALNEEYVYGEDGRLQNPSFLDYRMPVASDLPNTPPSCLNPCP